MKVSCIVTSYNKKEYLPAALDSILANRRNFPEGFEIIIVDDQSTDGSLAIANEYMGQYPEIIRVIVNEKNVGAGVSRDNGIKSAKGEWISLIDADDLVADDFFRVLYDEAITHDVDMIYGNYKTFVGNEEPFLNPFSYPNILLTDMGMAILNMPKYCLQFLNVSLTKKALYDNGVDYCPSRFIEDTPTAACLLHNAKRVYVSEYAGYLYRQVENSLIHSAPRAKYSIFLAYNFIWATKWLSEHGSAVAEELKAIFGKGVYEDCCLYRIDYNDFKQVSEEMWKDIVEYYDIDESRTTERKMYAIAHMSTVTKVG